MDLLERVLGRPEQRTEYEDFIDRFEKGSPYDGIDDREAVDRYERVTPELSRSQYRESAEEAFDRLSPAERAEFSHWLRTRANQRGVTVPDYTSTTTGSTTGCRTTPASWPR